MRHLNVVLDTHWFFTHVTTHAVYGPGVQMYCDRLSWLYWRFPEIPGQNGHTKQADVRSLPRSWSSWHCYAFGACMLLHLVMPQDMLLLVFM